MIGNDTYEKREPVSAGTQYRSFAPKRFTKALRGIVFYTGAIINQNLRV